MHIIINILSAIIAAGAALYVHLLWRKVRRERIVIDAQEIQLAIERKKFFDGIQEKASANATAGCRTCSVCKRVVHRYSPCAGGVICRECDITVK